MKTHTMRGVALIFRYAEAIAAFERSVGTLKQALKEEMAREAELNDVTMSLSKILYNMEIELERLKADKKRLEGND